MRRSILFVVVASGCGGFLSSSGDDSQPTVEPGGDAAVDAKAADGGTPTADGSAAGDAADAAMGCVILGPTAAAKWELLADADFEAASTARLNLVQFQSRGLIIAPGRHTIGRMKVSFDFVVERPPSGLDPGEGFTFMWSTAPVQPGGVGTKLGACDLATGFAVSFLDTGFVSLRRLSDCSQGQFATINDFTDSLAHHVEIDVDAAGHVRVFYDGAANATLEGEPPGYISLTDAWVGFSAATSDLDALHKVRDVKLELPDEPPCP